MEIKGTLQARDLKSAVWLQIAPRTPFALASIFLIFLFVLALWGMFLKGDSSRWLMLFLVLLLSSWFLRLPLAAARTYRYRRALQREFQLTVSANGLDFRNENGHITLPWSDYSKWKENETLYLLSPGDGMFFGMIPKRFFQSQGDVDAFRKMLEANVVER
jgi:hypothetical protein